MAAPTTTLLKSTPYAAVYHIAAAGTTVDPAAIDYTDAPTMAALVAGPYRYQIKKMLGILDHLNLDNADPRNRRIRIYRVLGVNLLETNPQTYTVVWTVNGLRFTLQDEAKASDLFIEIRLVHSSRR
jgi:hypothetical protein